ncbi:MAG TPA: ribosome-associated translation inhibitor RaiA [Phycisphaerales bacterium]|nr:ribosome-associated translation inhibitor RaiA [Phycisphaerales bacterium]
MRIDVVGRNMDLTDAIRQYATAKAGKLDKYLGDKLQMITVRIEPTAPNHKQEYNVELVLDVEDHADFVSHATGADPYAALDLVVEKGERQLREYKDQLKNHHHQRP